MHTETITWYAPAERLPDADLTVLVRMPEGRDEPVTQGFLDGEDWREAGGMPIDAPVLWAELPTGDTTKFLPAITGRNSAEECAAGVREGGHG